MGHVDPISAVIPPVQIREFELGTNVSTKPDGPRTPLGPLANNMVKVPVGAVV
jgi:hypothetical protein